MEEEAAAARQALLQATSSKENDRLADLRAHITTAEEKISSAQAKLLGKGIEKFFAENMWYIIFGIIIIIILSYLTTQIILPFYTLGKEINSLAKKEKELVKTRIETEKQYFRREIDEKTFQSILTEGQGKILRVRGSLKTKTEFRKTLLKTRLSPKAMFRWFKNLISKPSKK